MAKISKIGAGLVFWGLIIGILAGYGAAIHPAGDSFGVFRPQAAVALACLSLAALWFGQRRVALLGLAVAGFAGLPIAAAYSGLLPEPNAAHPYSLYQKNLSFRNGDLTPLEADIRAYSPDFVTLQEVTQSHKRLLVQVADILPYRHDCGFTAVGGTAVASRYPPVAGTMLCARGMALMQVITPDGPVWLASLHLHWPWPFGQAGQVKSRLAVMDRMAGSLIVGGDFNMVPWSRTMALVKAASLAQPAGPVRNTFPRFGPLFSLPIDHVLTPTGGTTQLRPLLGSDHYGLLVRFSLAAP